MGNSCCTSEEARLSEEEKKLDLSTVPAQDAFGFFSSFIATESVSEDDLRAFAKSHTFTLTNTGPLPHQKDFYDALRLTSTTYKPRLLLVAIILYGRSSPAEKSSLLYSVYCDTDQPSIDLIRALVYNMMDVSLNVSKRLLLDDKKVYDYIGEVRKGRKLLFGSIANALGSGKLTKDAFVQVMTRAEFQDLLTPTGLRTRMYTLVKQNKKIPQPSFVPAAAS